MRFYTIYAICHTICAMPLTLPLTPRKHVRVLIGHSGGPTYLGLVWVGLARPRYLLQYISTIYTKFLNLSPSIQYYISSRLILFYFILYYSRLQYYRLSNTSSTFYSSSSLTTIGRVSLLTYLGNRGSSGFALVSRFGLNILQIYTKVGSLSRYNVLRLFSTRYRPRGTLLNFLYSRSVASPFTSNKTSSSSQISINRRFLLAYFTIISWVFIALARPSLIILFIFFAISLLFTT